MAKPLGIGLLVLAVGLITGCSGIRPYTNAPDRNVRIRTDTESGSIFSNTRAHLGIYRVDAQCQIEYEGTVELDQPIVLVGLPPDRLNYLVFGFRSFSLLANATSSINQPTLLRTRPDHSYDIDVSYRRSSYNVSVRERQPRKGGSRDVELKRLDACRERSATVAPDYGL